MKNRIFVLTAMVSSVVLLAMSAGGCGAKVDQAAVNSGPSGVGAPTEPFPACGASKSWVTAPNPPTEIGGPGVPVGAETFCQFYQFAEQWFLDLVSPSSTPGSRTFETFNVVGESGMTSCPSAQAALTGPRLTGKEALKHALFARLAESKTADFDPTLPANLNQATGQGQYDQNGNIVLYAMLYNSTECQATPQGFVPNTIEVKTSWKILKAQDPSFYTMNATVQFSAGPQDLLLGLVGFHMAISTALHPEFIWATFEHKANDPDCNHPQPTPASGWSFTSSAAAQCLADGGLNACASFNFNDGGKAQSPTGVPTQTCRTYPDGTDPVPPPVGPNGNHNALNKFTIDTLNAQLVGPKGLLTSLPSGDPMAVMANYTMEGAIWTNGGLTSTDVNNQRGSLELANTTMETFVQSAPPAPNTLNCFGCHTYVPTTPLEVSHIYQSTSGKLSVLQRRAAAGKK